MKGRRRANFGESATPARHFHPDQSIIRSGVLDPFCGPGTPLSIAQSGAGCIETKAMSETQRKRKNISTMKEGKLLGKSPGSSFTAKSSLKWAARLNTEEAEAKHRRREDKAEANHRRWKERLYTRTGVGIALAVVLLCAAVLLLNYSAEDKKWASAILTHGAAALTTYLGVKAKSRGGSDEN